MLNKYRYILIISLLSFGFTNISAEAEETLTWQDCLRESAKNHPDLIAAKEEIKQSEAAKKITASTLFPQVNTNVNASTGRSDNGTSSANADSYGYGVTGSQLLFDGTKTINNVRADKENIKAAKQNFRFTSSAVRFRLRTAFVNLLKAQEMLRITQEIYDIRRGNLELITLRYQSGLEHKGALLTAEADLAQAEYEISLTKRNVEVAQRELTKEMGRLNLTPIEAKGDLAVKDPARQKPDFVALAKNNPSLQQLIAQKNAAGFQVKSAYASFSPTLTAQAGADKTGPHWSPRNDEWNAALTVSMPVFEGGLRTAQVSQAKALLNQLKANERSTGDGVILTLEQAWAALQDAVDNVEVQRKSLIATEERSKIAEAQYSIGFISFDNWTIIEDNLVSAKRSFLDAQANALYAEAEWIQAKGETLEYE